MARWTKFIVSSRTKLRYVCFLFCDCWPRLYAADPALRESMLEQNNTGSYLCWSTKVNGMENIMPMAFAEES